MNQPKVIIVEDEHIIALDLKLTLMKNGYEVLDIVHSGEKAIEKIQLMKPDLILMDIQLQGELSGIEAAFEINKLNTVNIVFMTGNADLVNSNKKIDGRTTLLKPIAEFELLDTVKKELE